jgi:hypothetical protein
LWRSDLREINSEALIDQTKVALYDVLYRAAGEIYAHLRRERRLAFFAFSIRRERYEHSTRDEMYGVDFPRGDRDAKVARAFGTWMISGKCSIVWRLMGITFSQVTLLHNLE